jgi:hypothetical protein
MKSMLLIPFHTETAPLNCIFSLFINYLISNLSWLNIYAEIAWLKMQIGSGLLRQKRYFPPRTAAAHAASR